jgi:hypothetical protein
MAPFLFFVNASANYARILAAANTCRVNEYNAFVTMSG